MSFCYNKDTNCMYVVNPACHSSHSITVSFVYIYLSYLTYHQQLQGVKWMEDNELEWMWKEAAVA
jgi:hypothetical protein